MNNLIKKVKTIKPKIEKEVNKRLSELKKNNLFCELSFCLLTANYSAERAIKIQEELKNDFCRMSKKQLSKSLKNLGYRFPNKRAEYIVKARKHELVMDRGWLVKNIKGLGMKEASHFLRNTGHYDYAIIDFHIIDLLVKHKLIKKPKNLSRKKYLEIEEVLRRIADELNMSLGELDFYLWYLETGKVLK